MDTVSGAFENKEDMVYYKAATVEEVDPAPEGYYSH